MSHKLFSELGLSDEIQKALEKMGFEQASPIQSESIPPLLEGKDLIGQSQTGSGKTAAFGVPAVQSVDEKLSKPQVLIVCPTRELAAQVAEEIAKIAAFKPGVRELPIYGGASYDRQFRGLRAGPQIVIGTPGRLIDHIESGALNLEAVKMVILDEGDRMLDMGFREDIEKILKATHEDRQTVIFSATLPPAIKNIIKTFTKDPVHIKIESTAVTMPAIEQSYVEVDYRSKTEVLCRLLDVHDVSYGIIFGFTKVQVDEVTEALLARGYSADKLHGDMAQNMRERTMKRFRERQFDLLVATDVAARGLDVDDLEIVFNYELPHDPEDYVHRIGRTGRAGRSGKAISLVAGREYGRLQQVLRFTKADIARLTVPRIDEVEERRASRIADTIKETLEAREFKSQEMLSDQLIASGYTPTEIISALMHLLGEETLRPVERIREDEPKGPRPPRDRFERPDRQDRPDRGPPRDGERDYAAARPHRPERVMNEGAGPSRIDESNGTWIKLSVGGNVGVQPRDIVGCITGEAGLSRDVIGTIKVFPALTLAQVTQQDADHIIKSVTGSTLRGKVVHATHGTPPTPGPGPRRDGPPARGGYGGERRDDGGPPRRSFGDRDRPPGGGFGGGGGGGGSRFDRGERFRKGY
jgi:ATP-dependent RNA helicase DeaD